MGMKNDVSMLMHSRMALFEHQSTYNPNMPIRGFMYAARLYNKYIEENRLNIYSKTLMELPIPQYIVFYNGDDKHKDEEILRLSEAFVAAERTEGYEWTARMLNINYGRNKKLMEKCKPLRDYAILIDKIKRYTAEKKSIEEAVAQAVDECIKEDVLADFLRKHRAEVMDVCITEYDEKRVMDAIREESHDEGYGEGYGEGYEKGCEITAAQEKVQAVENVMASLNISAKEACKILQYLLEDYEAAKALVEN